MLQSCAYQRLSAVAHHTWAAARRLLADPACWALGTLAMCGALPLGLLLTSSLIDADGRPSFEHYHHVLASAAAWRSLGRSFALALIATATACLLGVPYAYVVSRWRIPGRRVWLVLGALPLLIPAHVHVMAWLNLGADVRVVTMILNEARGLAGGVILAGGIQGFSLMPLVLWFAAAAFSRLDGALIDAARLDGSRWDVMRHVILPAALPGIAAGALVVFCLALLGYEIPWILGIDTYTAEVRSRFDTSWSFAAAAAATVPLLVLVGSLAVALIYALRRLGGLEITVSLEPHCLETVTSNRRLWLGCLYPAFVLMIALVVPLAALLKGTEFRPEPFVRAIGMGRGMGMGLGIGMSLSQGHGADLLRSVVTALAVALLAGTLCWPLGYRLAHGSRVWRIAWPVVLLPLAASPALLGIGLIYLMNHPAIPGALYDSPLKLIVGGLARLAPVSLLASVAASRTVAVELEQAAAVDGASRLQTLRWIVLPLTRAGMIAGAVAVFVLMMGETGVSSLLRPPGWETYTSTFMSLVHFGLVNLLSALALVQLVVCAVPVLIGAIFLLRSDR